MSTSLLYHTWGIRGHAYIRARDEKGSRIFRVEQEESSLRSSCCGSREVKKRGATERTFKTTPVGNRPVFIELPVPRVECQGCGAVRQVNVQFAKQRRSYTKGFERYALELSRHMRIQDVATTSMWAGTRSRISNSAICIGASTSPSWASSNASPSMRSTSAVEAGI